MGNTISPSKLRYSLVPNTLREKDGYHAVLAHVDTTDAETFYARAAARRAGLDAATMRLTMDAVLTAAATILSERQYRIALGDVTFELAIPGSTDSINGTPTEGAYVGVYPSVSLRGAAAGVAPVYAPGEGERTEVYSVEDVATRATGGIVGSNPFRIAGANISGTGDDETIAVVAADGTEATAEVDSEDGAGMFITAHLAAPLPPGKGKVVLTTHGKRTPEGELRTLVKSVTILAGDTPPVGEPTITSAKTRGESEGSVNIAGGILDVEGTNLGTATAVELHSDVQPTGEASLWQTLPAPYADGKLTSGELDFDEKPSDGGFVRVATAGGSALYPITYCAH